MRYRAIIYLSILALLTLSCQKEGDVSSGVKHIRFNASVNAHLDYTTRADGDSKFGVGTHNMGLWVCDADGNPSYNYPTIEEYRNCRIEYTRSEESEQWMFYGNGREWANSIALDDGRGVNIYSYYPWNENVTDLTSIPFESGSTDYLWCEPISLSDDEVTGDGVLSVNLNYKRIMTCIEVAVKANVNNAIMLNEIKLKDLTGANIAISGTYNAINGDVTLNDEGKIDNITYLPAVMLTNDDTTPKIEFVIPEYENYSEDNFELSFKFNNIDGAMTFRIPSTISQNGTLESGKKYIVTLQLNEAMKFSVVDFKTTDDWNSEIHQTDIDL